MAHDGDVGVSRGDTEHEMKTRALLLAVAVVSSAVAAPALAGDVSAERYWTQQVQKSTSRIHAGQPRGDARPAGAAAAVRCQCMP